MTLRHAWMVVPLVFAISSNASAASAREKREVAMAESAILWAMIAGSSERNRSECLKNAFACSDDRADLGMLLLGAKSSLYSTHALVSLLRFRLDGSLASDFRCYVLSGSRGASAVLATVSASSLRATCEAEKTRAIRAYPYLMAELGPNAVCTVEPEIERQRLQLLAALKQGKSCVHE